MFYKLDFWTWHLLYLMKYEIKNLPFLENCTWVFHKSVSQFTRAPFSAPDGIWCLFLLVLCGKCFVVWCKNAAIIEDDPDMFIPSLDENFSWWFYALPYKPLKTIKRVKTNLKIIWKKFQRSSFELLSENFVDPQLMM